MNRRPIPPRPNYYDPAHLPNQEGLVFYARIGEREVSCTVLRAKTGMHYVVENSGAKRVRWSTVTAWRYP